MGNVSKLGRGISLTAAFTLMLIIVSVTPGSASATLENMNAGTSLGDTKVHSGAPNTNYGTLSTLEITIPVAGGGFVECALFKFPVTTIPASQNIDNAYFYVYATAGYANKNIGVYTVSAANQNWQENVITWNTRPAKATYADNYVTAQDTAMWLKFNVKGAVENAYNGNWENVTFICDYVSDNAVTYHNLNSKEAASNRPYLEVVYSGIGVNSTITVDNATIDNYTVDRDNDGYSTGGLGVMISVMVSDNLGRDNITSANTLISIFDNAGLKLVDNAQFDNYENVSAVTKRFSYNYNPSDALTDAQLGTFDVIFYVKDLINTENTKTSSELFMVDDLCFNGMGAENLTHHRTRIYGQCERRGLDNVEPEHVTIVDNTVGTYNLDVLVSAFENTYTVGAFGNFYAYALENGLDGRSTGTVTYAFPNMRPEVTYFNSSEALVDRKRDSDESSPTLTTSLTIRVRDNDNRDDINAIRFLVRDNANTVQDNQNAWSSKTVVDENTYQFTVSVFNPSNTNDNMGGWDVGGYVADNWQDNTNWGNNTFIVDDLDVLAVTVTPENTDYGITWGYYVTVSSTPTRKSGIAASADNSWVDDAHEGTFVAGAGASVAYLISSDPGSVVPLVFRAIDGVLDGENTDTYTVTENRVYTWWLKYEENGQPYDLVSGVTYSLLVYYLDGTGSTAYIDDNEGLMVVQKEVYDLTVRYDNDSNNTYDYIRTTTPLNPSENIFFYLVSENNKTLLLNYTYTLIDYTNTYGVDENGIIAFQKTPDNLATITRVHWGIGSAASVYLINGTRYQITLYASNGTVRTMGYEWATLTTARTLIVRPLVPDNILYIHDYISWAAYRENENIVVMFFNGYGDTDNVTISIYALGNTTPEYDTTEYMDNVELIWYDAENDTSYRVELVAYSTAFGVLSESHIVGPNLGGYVITPSGVEDIADLVGSPIPLMTMLSMVIVTIVMLSFGGEFAGIGLFVTAGIMSFLVLVGWLAIDAKVLIFVWVLAFFYYIGRAKRGGN